MKSGTWFLVLLSVAVVLSGCTTSPGGAPIQYSNNIVAIENYGVSTTNPYPGSGTSISFWVKNNGDKAVSVAVDFFNVPNNLNAMLSCEGGAAKALEDLKGKCENIKLEPFDTKPVKLELAMPSDNVLSPIPYTIAFSVNYTWTGYRSASIPIIDGTTVTKPVSQFSQSQPSYGPVSVDFQPPIGRTYKQDKQTITEHWGLIGRPFEVRMSFRHIGNPSGMLDQPFFIQPNQITISAENMGVAPSPVYCAFKRLDGSTGACTDADLAGGKCAYPSRLELPGELVCNFESAGSAMTGETVGTVSASYTYDYRFSRTETIIEQPAPQ